MSTKTADRKTVFLIEDSADDEALTLRALGQLEQADVTVVRDGAEAVDFFSPNPTRIPPPPARRT